MGDHCITIVPRQSTYPGKEIKAEEVLQWLISWDIINPTLSDCVLSSANGYPISKGAKLVSEEPDCLPFNLKINGLEVKMERQVFDTGQNGMEELICPNCQENIAEEDWDFFSEWAEAKSNNLVCPLCNVPSDIHQFRFTPDWGFSDLGFSFWNWSAFKDNFIKYFKEKLGCDVDLVYRWI